ncbi:unnamed protein product [Linum trigynum]|uniref:Uncharacterized protein n=1 Tax=Linum trigynum TaxID=586398 RepID=A0AAV2E577_9ROSI
MGYTTSSIVKTRPSPPFSQSLPAVETQSSTTLPPPLSYDEKKYTELFLKDQIQIWIFVGGYISIAIVSAIILPRIFHQLSWYHIVVIYTIAPVLAFCNAYGQTGRVILHGKQATEYGASSH